MLYFFVLLLLLKYTDADTGGIGGLDNLLGNLTGLLTDGSLIITNTLSSVSAPRWSQYKEPVAPAVARIVTELDVVTVVTNALASGVPFFAQAGGHGWSDSINFDPGTLVIDLKWLNSTHVSDDKKSITVEGGVITQDLVTAANSKGVMVTTGNCNTVGYIGQALGGGYGNMATSRNLGHFNLISLNIVLANGTFAQGVSATNHPDLFYAMRGAGPNFGIVTSAVVKAYPITGNSNMAYLAQLYYNESQLEQVITAMNKTSINQPGAAYLFFTRSAIVAQSVSQFFVFIYYYGNEAGALSAFKYLYNVGPVNITKVNGTGVVDWTGWNAFSSLVDAKGGYKPSWGANMRYLNPTTWRTIFNGFKDLVTNPYYTNASGMNDFNTSYVLLEQYYVPGLWGPQTPQYSFPVSQTRFISAITPWYYTPGFESNATSFGNSSRALLRQDSGIKPYVQYINYAFGDESPDMVYGSSLCNLSALKNKYDPNGMFNSWFPIPLSWPGCSY